MATRTQPRTLRSIKYARYDSKQECERSLRSASFELQRALQRGDQVRAGQMQKVIEQLSRELLQIQAIKSRSIVEEAQDG